MSIPVLAIARFLVPIPGWVLIAYVAIAAAMAIALLVEFLRHSRARRNGNNAWLILLILFFPLMALGMVWPISLPFAVYVLWKERRDERQKPRGFAVMTKSADPSIKNATP